MGYRLGYRLLGSSPRAAQEEPRSSQEQPGADQSSQEQPRAAQSTKNEWFSQNSQDCSHTQKMHFGSQNSWNSLRFIRKNGFRGEKSCCGSRTVGGGTAGLEPQPIFSQNAQDCSHSHFFRVPRSATMKKPSARLKCARTPKAKPALGIKPNKESAFEKLLI